MTTVEAVPRLTVFRGTVMEDLADHLLSEVHRELCGGGVFASVPVIVPNKSIARFLSLRFAGSCGIAAGLQFPFLMSLFEEKNLVRADGTAPSETCGGAVNAGTLIWRIALVLPDLIRRGLLPERLNGAGLFEQYQFARKMAGIFDRYLLYRPELINRWEREIPQNGDWQALLWRAAVRERPEGHHFAAVFRKILEGELVPGVGGAVRIFGFAAIPPAVLRCLEKFALRRPVELYCLVPSREFFGDSKTDREELRELVAMTGNRDDRTDRLAEVLKSCYFQHHVLVAGLAAQARTLLQETIEWPEGEAASAPPAGDTLLHKLQRWIMRDTHDPEEAPPAEPCRSIQIRSCCSVFREVETAHNYLLHCFEEIPGLTPDDVFIMSPTPERYAPLVDAVFNHTFAAGRPAVSIADRSPGAEQRALHTFLRVLTLFKGHFSAAEVFAVLQDRDLQACHALTPDDCRFCMDRAAAAGIRWGFDAEEHRSAGGVAFAETSWRAGLDRLMLPYALESDSAQPYESIFPVTGFDGGRGVLLGKFSDLVLVLRNAVQRMRAAEADGMKFAAWKGFLLELAAALFGSEAEVTGTLLKFLGQWEEEMSAAGADGLALTGDVIVHRLRSFLETPADSSLGFRRGRITFCSLRPMRSIPARVIVLLGMNHDVFPAGSVRQDIDLLHQAPRPGDPDAREDSRQLFLDLLLSARDAFYLSYIGRGNHDGKRFPPSVCVGELRNCLRTGFGKKSFVDLEEPLQAYSPALFVPGAPNQSYSRTLFEAARAVSAPGRGARPVFAPGRLDDADGAMPERLALTELLDFFRNPAAAFLRKKLNLSLRFVGEESIPEAEPFAEGYLPYDRQDELLAALRRTPVERRSALAETQLARFKADGILPYPWCEEQWQTFRKAAALAEMLPEAGVVRPSGEAEIELADGTRVRLEVPEIVLAADGVQYWPGFQDDLNGFLVLRGIVMHLGANLLEPTAGAIATPRGVYRAGAMEKNAAEEKMRTLLEFYRAGMREPLCFFPRTSYAAFTAPDDDLSDVEKVWRERDEAEYGVLFGTLLPDPDKVRAVARGVFGAVSFGTREDARDEN